VPISQFIGTRVAWDRKKTNASRGDYWACCPFHGEKSPSFHCEDKKGRYHCFGCSVSGDHFKFLTELDGMSFPEAVEKIAEMAGVPMPVRDEREERREKERASLTDVMEMATAFFQDRLQSADGAKARAYLRDAQVLILDEPTAALDARAEYEVFERFSDLTKGKMTLLISHRFSTVRMSDRIVVLEGGRIVEEGRHDKLVALGGRYAEMFELQASSYR